jgi:hypothetical protein
MITFLIAAFSPAIRSPNASAVNDDSSGSGPMALV